MSDDELARLRALATAPRSRHIEDARLDDAHLADAARELVPALLAEVARLRSLTLAVSIERDTLEVERDEARREAERLRSEVAWSERIAHDLRALVAHATRAAGGMQVPWHHELANASRLPSVVHWARWHLARRDIAHVRAARDASREELARDE
jgi:hypothetical protein